MCIIFYHPKGADYPDKETFKTMFENNPDGAGFAYPLPYSRFTEDKYKIFGRHHVQIKKGYMVFDELYKALSDVTNNFTNKNLPIMVHFRIATHGNVDGGACHPFPCSKKIAQLRATKIDSSVAICHNGIITNCAKKGTKLSDTQIFVKDYLTSMKLYQDISKSKCDLIEKIIGPMNRMVIMNSQEEVALIGNFVEDNGCFYSNTSYKKYVPVTFTYPKCYSSSYYLGEPYNFGKQYKKDTKGNKELSEWGLEYYDCY